VSSSIIPYGMINSYYPSKQLEFNMNNSESSGKKPPICDYEGSDYQTRFWELGGRAYEDGCEAIALKRILPKTGGLMLEVGAGAGRNSERYKGFNRIILLDYSQTQLQQAKKRLGTDGKYVYVVADIYRLPFVDNLFDSTTMIRVLHHMADAPLALKQLRNTLKPSSSFILEYANKRNLKAIIRYILRKQKWNPFSEQPVEFTPLNFDFHPRVVRKWLSDLDFKIDRTLTVSHFRIGWFKRNIPVSLLIQMDSILQWSGFLFQLTPSVFLRAHLHGKHQDQERDGKTFEYFKCPACNNFQLEENPVSLHCPSCGKNWPIKDGIYIFKE
jgi:SAM-dependent methyltransferase